MQMRRFRFNFSRLTHIFISHMHGDHCFGLPGLISSLGMLGRKGDLFIHGPEMLGEYIESTLRLFCEGLAFQIRFNPVDTNQYGLVMEDRSVSVYSIPLKHRIPCCGYLFVEKQGDPHIIREMIDYYQVPIHQIQRIKAGADFVTASGEVIPHERLTRPAAPSRKYAYCSDTGYYQKIVEYVRGVDLLYHEATFLKKDEARAYETFHSTAEQAAAIAKEAQVKRLMIGHYSARYNNLNPLRQEAEQVFPGTILAKEGLKFSL